MAYPENIPDSMADTFINVNGELIPSDEAHVSAFDRGFLYGDAVFDSTPVYDSRVVLIERHVDRLFRSIDAVKIDTEITKEELLERVRETLEESNVEYGGVRMIVSRGVGQQGIKNADTLGDPTVVVIPHHTPKGEVSMGQESPARAKARIVSTRTIPPDSISPVIKDCNYLNNALAERELQGTDASCAIMLNHHGQVAEAYDGNVFAIDHRGVITMPPATHALEGVTRAVVLELVDELGYTAETKDINSAHLYAAQDVFLSGSGRGITSVPEIDGRQIDDGHPGEIVEEVSRELRKYVLTNECMVLDT